MKRHVHRSLAVTALAALLCATAAVGQDAQDSAALSLQPDVNEVPALVLAGEETTLSSQMAGRIRKVNFGLGESVGKGATLLEFDCSEQQAQLDTASADHRAARDTHLARLRLQALGAAGELEVTVAAAAADKARSQIDLRESQLAYCKVDAPFSGRVARLRVKASESVNAGLPLIELVNPAFLRAQMFVPAAWIARVRVGGAMLLQMKDTGRSYRASISKVNARVDGVSQQLEIEARIGNPDARLLPGMVGMARLVASAPARARAVQAPRERAEKAPPRPAP